MSDSRDPEIAGIGGALVGSFYSILICLVVSFSYSCSSVNLFRRVCP